MPNGLSLALVVLIISLILSFLISMLLNLFSPYIPTPRKKLKKMVKDMNLKKGDVFVDLGSGDGRVVFEVARQYKNVQCIGYEFSPIPLIFANLKKMFLFPFSIRVQIKAENFLKANLTDATVFYASFGKDSKYSLFLKSLEKNGAKVIRA